MEFQSRRFLLSFLIAVSVVASVIGVFNILADSYGLFASRSWFYAIDSNAAGPSTDYERLTKSYDVLRKAPSSLILGSSSVDVGLDARSSVWPRAAMPVYNLGLFSIDLRGMYQYLQHVIRSRSIGLVVIGIDFDQFLGRWMTPLSERDRARVDGPSVGVLTQDFLRSSLSFDALADNISSVADEVVGWHPTFVSGNYPEDKFSRFKRREGPAGFFWFTDIRNISVAALKPGVGSQIDDLRAIVDLCLSNNVKAVVIMGPVHANLLETYSRMGYWEAFENWKRELVSMTARVGNEHHRPDLIELWDFEEYNQYSTTDLPQATDWFWDTNHYTRRLGDLILLRLFGHGNPGFGAPLTLETIEQHLQVTRERQQQFRLAHPGAVNSLKLLIQDTPH